MEKIKNEVIATKNDLFFMFGAALRYGLGRQSYATGLIPQVIIDNFSLLDENCIINLLRDINRYEQDRIAWNTSSEDKYGKYDGECDYVGWLDLKAKLIKEYDKKGIDTPLKAYGIEVEPIGDGGGG